MANEEQLAILRQGVGVWNAWRKSNSESTVNLMGADLSEVDLSEVDLSRADLSEVDLSRAKLSRGDLRAADLREANLTDAVLRETNLIGAVLRETNLIRADLRVADLHLATLHMANLSEANLSEADLRVADLRVADLRIADLRGANLRGANLRGANLREARLHSTVFGNNDLSEVYGLNAVLHTGPSTIGIDTLYRSAGKIPEVFLRGCGVPESLIEYLPSLLGAMQPIQFYSCFISYSTKDHEFAQRLYERMQSHGLRVWFAPEELKGGYKLDEQIDHAIRLYDKLILVLSDESVRSKWVMKEIRNARQEELANQRRKLFPIRLTDMRTLDNWECFDPPTGHDLADEVRQYFIPDFSAWKDHDSFEYEFKKLLDALKAVDEPPVPGPPPEKVLAYKRRLLLHLQNQRAGMGLTTPPGVLIDIEDLEREIARLEGE